MTKFCFLKKILLILILIPSIGNIYGQRFLIPTALDSGKALVIDTHTVAFYRVMPDDFVLLDWEPTPLNISEFRAAVGYTPSPQQAGISENVIIRVFVDKTGTPKSCKVLKEFDKQLFLSIIYNLHRLNFSPGIQAGREVGCWTTIKIHFPDPLFFPDAYLPPLPPPGSSDSLISRSVDVEAKPVNMEYIRTKIGYPAMAKANGIQGKVIAKIFIDKAGSYVRHVIVQSADAQLQSAVENALPSLQFTQALKNSKPVDSWIIIPFSFVLAE